MFMYDYRAQAWEKVGAVPQPAAKVVGGPGSMRVMRGLGRLSVTHAERFVGASGKIKIQLRKRQDVRSVHIWSLDISISGES